MEFKVGDLVWLSTENLNTNLPSKKFKYRRVGPFELIECVNEVAYKLKLPQSMRIHPVFHVSLLSRFVAPNAHQDAVRPDPVVIEVVSEFEVVEILSSRNGKSGSEFLVKWKGYDDYENSCEPIENVINYWDLVKEFYKNFRTNVHRPSSMELRKVGKFLPEGM